MLSPAPCYHERASVMRLYIRLALVVLLLPLTSCGHLLGQAIGSILIGTPARGFAHEIMVARDTEPLSSDLEVTHSETYHKGAPMATRGQLPSGWNYRIVKAGTGALALPGERVRFHVTITTPGGVIAQDTFSGGAPLSRTIRADTSGWQQALHYMRAGATWTLTKDALGRSGGTWRVSISLLSSN